MPTLRHQQGVALISVLLVMAIATVIASEVASRVSFHIQRTDNQQTRAQAYQYALGGEALVRQVLHEDLENSEYDHLGEKWATLKPLYKFDQGQLKIQLVDLQSRLNINNLVTREGLLNEPAYIQFLKLFNTLALDPQLLDTLVDWLDKDSTPKTINSEDTGYLASETPYRAANRPLAHLSELALLQGWTQKDIDQLAPFVIALPTATRINVNTASATVLSTLAEKLTPLNSANLVASQQNGGFQSMDEFLAHDQLAGIAVNSAAADIHSDYFSAYVVSDFADKTVHLHSIFYRNPASGEIKLVSRDRSSHFLWPEEESGSRVTSQVRNL
ncbi:MAG: type II secretion system minor pseudopilin GspK [Pseudomonadales bacterium]|jgi:general secretion pathway protein K